jgi:hypothetical protein
MRNVGLILVVEDEEISSARNTEKHQDTGLLLRDTSSKIQLP